MKNHFWIADNSVAVRTLEFAIGFVTIPDEIDGFVSNLFLKLIGDANLWMCYPKQTSK